MPKNNSVLTLRFIRLRTKTLILLPVILFMQSAEIIDTSDDREPEMIGTAWFSGMRFMACN